MLIQVALGSQLFCYLCFRPLPKVKALFYFSRVSDPQQKAMLHEALNEHCREHGICAADKSRDETARRIMHLFDNGMRRPADFRFQLAAL